MRGEVAALRPAPRATPAISRSRRVTRATETARREARALLGALSCPALDELSNPAAYLASHSRSFRFAASMMAKSDRARIARVYAWCRYTDNLVDGDGSAELAERRLDHWLRVRGRPTTAGIAGSSW